MSPDIELELVRSTLIPTMYHALAAIIPAVTSDKLMRDKLKTLDEAARCVENGAQLAMSANMNRSPMALLRQVVRQGTRRLRVVGVVGGEIDIDFLVGAGAVDVVDTCSVTLGEFARTAPNFARYVLAGKVRALDNT
jgi:glutaconate CoA-transferase, subunit A